MKRVYTSTNSAEVGLMQSLLDGANIPCEVRNEAVSQALVLLPFAPELWILRDEDFEEAKLVISEFGGK
jgi:hypothetical protein